ncbi:uncharacterized protein BXZ73DRAFT_76306 [Epithele typhae]|uniref:uncharacterized protein n=1 Tax=Epithele typhae TaxID=378194 RepID=UPI0020083E14|nr:uncharacterized protein BXZ73DRAFT_76306 [Epithele typhae]KAH9938798.1 hypothetical protein BXZ73DRAFT_76306 [Epithele typhae]
MADTKVASSKLAMSRALGAAFLSHQVEQLEKSVTTGNWRDRPKQDNWRTPDPAKRNFAGPKIMKKRNEGSPEERGRFQGAGRGEKEHDKRSEERKGQKDADFIVLDASVLIHGIYHLKQWSKDGREEVVIVPLEALNTLDLLKKGTSALAQRARNASRILEAQVGTNPRIRVQQDDAFVLWDKISFDDQTAATPNMAPEWVRRTICCARWEVEHAAEREAPFAGEKGQKKLAPRIVLAVAIPPADAQLDAPTPAPISASPVPLPAPQANRHESRLAGALVSRWAAKAGVEVVEVTTAPPQPAGGAPTEAKGRRSGEAHANTPGGGNGRRSGEEDRAKRGGTAGRGRRNSRGAGIGAGAAARAPAPPAVNSSLVERPAAVMTMMEMVTQPNRVVRVLARGEKLDP